VALKGRQKFNNLVNEVNREAILQKKRQGTTCYKNRE
jgi:hypothetical protein